MRDSAEVYKTKWVNYRIYRYVSAGNQIPHVENQSNTFAENSPFNRGWIILNFLVCSERFLAIICYILFTKEYRDLTRHLISFIRPYNDNGLCYIKPKLLKWFYKVVGRRIDIKKIKNINQEIMIGSTTCKKSTSYCDKLRF